MKKSFFIVLLVLALCCSSVWAFPAAKVSSSESSVEEVAKSVPSNKGTKKSENSVAESTEPASKLSDLQTKSKTVSKKEVQALANELAAIDEEYQELTKDALRVHPFFNAGAIFGLNEDDDLKVGAMVNGGLKLKTGMTVGANLQYFFVNTDTKKFKNNFNASAYIGWMF